RDAPKQLERNTMDDFIRISHAIAANIELYTLANETVPDCLRDMQRVVDKKISDVSVKIQQIQTIARQGDDYQSSACFSFKLFNCKKKPAVINPDTHVLLNLLLLPANDAVFILDLDRAYRGVVDKLNQKKQPAATTPAISAPS